MHRPGGVLLGARSSVVAPAAAHPGGASAQSARPQGYHVRIVTLFSSVKSHVSTASARVLRVAIEHGWTTSPCRSAAVAALPGSR